jgi:hypothetical protein
MFVFVFLIWNGFSQDCSKYSIFGFYYNDKFIGIVCLGV